MSDTVTNLLTDFADAFDYLDGGNNKLFRAHARRAWLALKDLVGEDKAIEEIRKLVNTTTAWTDEDRKKINDIVGKKIFESTIEEGQQNAGISYNEFEREMAEILSSGSAFEMTPWHEKELAKLAQKVNKNDVVKYLTKYYNSVDPEDLREDELEVVGDIFHVNIDFDGQITPK